jgi:hypothetical protein
MNYKIDCTVEVGRFTVSAAMRDGMYREARIR